MNFNEEWRSWQERKERRVKEIVCAGKLSVRVTCALFQFRNGVYTRKMQPIRRQTLRNINPAEEYEGCQPTPLAYVAIFWSLDHAQREWSNCLVLDAGTSFMLSWNIQPPQIAWTKRTKRQCLQQGLILLLSHELGVFILTHLLQFIPSVFHFALNSRPPSCFITIPLAALITATIHLPRTYYLSHTSDLHYMLWTNASLI